MASVLITTIRTPRARNTSTNRSRSRLPLISVTALPGRRGQLPQGTGAHGEAEAGERIAKSPLIARILQSGIPEGAIQLDRRIPPGQLEQPLRIEEPAHLLLGIEHAVAVDSEHAPHHEVPMAEPNSDGRDAP